MARSLAGALLAALVTWMPLALAAPAPKLAGEVTLPQPIRMVRATPDGKRAVALLEAAHPDGTVKVVVLDIENGYMPVAKGSITVDASGGAEIALAPDGRMALMTFDVAKLKPQYRHAIVALNLANAAEPSELWRLEVTGRSVVLASDASAYAVARPATQSSDWEILFRRIKPQQPDRVISAKGFSPLSLLQLSAHAQYIAYTRWQDELSIISLQLEHPVIYEQESSLFSSRHECLAAVLDTGYALVEDRRAPRLGVYAPQDHVPRIGVLLHEDSKACRRLDADDSQGVVTLADNFGLRRIDVRSVQNSALSGYWTLPVDVTPSAVVGSVVYAIRGKERQQLALLRLDEGAASSVDWPALEIAARREIEQYTAAVKSGAAVPFVIPTMRLEQAGVVQAIGAAPQGISPQSAAAILNDYGFLATKMRDRSQTAEAALRRAMELDPKRALAPLNLAELLRGRLHAVTSASEKQVHTAEIARLYRKSLALGGKRSTEMDAFVNGGRARDAGLDACSAIAAFTNGGQLQSYVSDSAINVEVGERRMDLVFSTQGTAHVPVVAAFDAETDFPLDTSALTIPGDGELWGGDQLGLFVHGKMAHVLHYRDWKHPVESTPLSGGGGCRFSNTVTERVGPNAAEPALCSTLLDGKRRPAIELTATPTIAHEVIARTYSETHAASAGLLNFLNEGRLLNVVKLELTSGAGPGCNAFFYDMLNDAGDALSSSRERALLMQLQKVDPADRYPVRPCGNDPRFFEHDGKVYFETKSAAWPPPDQWEEYHRVTRIEGGNVREVCDFRFESQVMAR